MKQTTLCLERKTFNLFIDLQTEFNKLYISDQHKFVRRVGFNPKTYKDFFETGQSVCVHLGLAVGDLKWENGRIRIVEENLDKREVNKEYVGLPFSKLPLE